MTALRFFNDIYITVDKNFLLIYPYFQEMTSLSNHKNGVE